MPLLFFLISHLPFNNLTLCPLPPPLSHTHRQTSCPKLSFFVCPWLAFNMEGIDYTKEYISPIINGVLMGVALKEYMSHYISWKPFWEYK